MKIYSASSKKSSVEAKLDRYIGKNVWIPIITQRFVPYRRYYKPWDNYQIIRILSKEGNHYIVNKTKDYTRTPEHAYLCSESNKKRVLSTVYYITPSEIRLPSRIKTYKEDQLFKVQETKTKRKKQSDIPLTRSIKNDIDFFRKICGEDIWVKCKIRGWSDQQFIRIVSIDDVSSEEINMYKITYNHIGVSDNGFSHYSIEHAISNELHAFDSEISIIRPVDLITTEELLR